MGMGLGYESSLERAIEKRIWLRWLIASDKEGEEGGMAHVRDQELMTGLDLCFRNAVSGVHNVLQFLHYRFHGSRGINSLSMWRH